MLSSRAVIFSDEWPLSRHDVGKVDGCAEAAAWASAEFCEATESVPASVIRTLSSTRRYFPGRTRSVLGANIPNGLQARSRSDHPPIAMPFDAIGRSATGPGKSVLA